MNQIVNWITMTRKKGNKNKKGNVDLNKSIWPIDPTHADITPPG